MKRPSVIVITVIAAVAIIPVTLFVTIGVGELAGDHRTDIWANVWLIIAMIIAAVPVILLLLSGVMYLFDHHTVKARITDTPPPDDSATTSNNAVISTINSEADATPIRHMHKDESNDSVLKQPSLYQSQVRQQQSGAALVASGTVVIAIGVAVAIGIYGCGALSNRAGLTTHLARGSMPQRCTVGGPVVFVVSGRQNSPAPGLTTSMASAATKAIRYGSPIGFVNLDGNPQLVTSRLFGNIGQSALTRRFGEQEDLNWVAKEVSGIRATKAHADVLDALEAAGRAVREACSHGGNVYLADSGLQETGHVNFRKLGLLRISPEEVVAQLKHEGNLPGLKGMTVELVGIGDTAPPQHRLSIAQRNWLIAVWSTIVKAAGGVVVADTTQREGGAPTHVPSVQLVPTR